MVISNYQDLDYVDTEAFFVVMRLLMDQNKNEAESLAERIQEHYSQEKDEGGKTSERLGSGNQKNYEDSLITTK